MALCVHKGGQTEIIARPSDGRAAHASTIDTCEGERKGRDRGRRLDKERLPSLFSSKKMTRVTVF